MIKEIQYNEVVSKYYEIIQEIEFGNHFEPNNIDHIRILNNRLLVNKARNAKYYSSETNDFSNGFISIIENENIFLKTIVKFYRLES